MCVGDGVAAAGRWAGGDGDANRETFGSSGTADDSAPYPLARAVLVSVAWTRAVLAAAFDGSGVGEQTLIARIVAEHPGVFAGGRVFLFDRNFLGAQLIAKILTAGGHVLMRVKSDIALPNLGWRRDGSYNSHLCGPEGPIPVRVVEYDVAAPDGTDAGDELFCLVTDLTDDEKYPASALAAAYPRRWTGAETTIKENKATITDAGPSQGPIFRSTTPDMVRQEFWARLTATNLIRAEARRAARHAAGPARPRPARAAHHVPARQVFFTATTREAIRGLTLSTRTAASTTTAASLAITRTAAALLPQLIQLDRNRHRPRVTKHRQQFPPPNAEPEPTDGPATSTRPTRYPAPVDTRFPQRRHRKDPATPPDRGTGAHPERYPGLRYARTRQTPRSNLTDDQKSPRQEQKIRNT